MKKNKGFTVIEVLVSLSILVILFGISLGVFYAQRKAANIENDAQNVLTQLQKARNQTLSSVNNSSFGVRFTASSSALFEGTTYSQAGTLFTFPFSSNVTTSLTGGVTQVYFERLTGEPSATGTITFQSNAGTTTPQTIIIRATGLAEIQ